MTPRLHCVCICPLQGGSRARPSGASARGGESHSVTRYHDHDHHHHLLVLCCPHTFTQHWIMTWFVTSQEPGFYDITAEDSQIYARSIRISAGVSLVLQSAWMDNSTNSTLLPQVDRLGSKSVDKSSTTRKDYDTVRSCHSA